MSAERRLCTLQENPHFWFQTIKVRPPDGTNGLKRHERYWWFECEGGLWPLGNEDEDAEQRADNDERVPACQTLGACHESTCVIESVRSTMTHILE